MTCLSSPTSEAQELADLGLTGKMPEKLMGSFCSLSQIPLDQQWRNTMINTGSSSPWWFKLKDKNGLKKHADITTFLLESLLTNFNDCFGLILIVIGYQLYSRTGSCCCCWGVTVSQNASQSRPH